MEVDDSSASATLQKLSAMRDGFKQRMEGKKQKKIRQSMKLSTKSKVISKGTSYSDKYEARRN